MTTQAAVDALQAAELIQPWPLNLQQGENTVPVQGFYRIDETALNALPDDAFMPLRKTGALPPGLRPTDVDEPVREIAAGRRGQGKDDGPTTGPGRAPGTSWH